MLGRNSIIKPACGLKTGGFVNDVKQWRSVNVHNIGVYRVVEVEVIVIAECKLEP